jgi:GGDEF domain-containing protein
MSSAISGIPNVASTQRSRPSEEFRLAQNGPPAEPAMIDANLFDFIDGRPTGGFAGVIQVPFDFLANGINRMLGLPEISDASRRAPIVVATLKKAGVAGPDGELQIPNTPLGARILVQTIMLAGSMGDLTGSGLHAIAGFDRQILRDLGVSPEFITEFERYSNEMALTGFVASVTSLAALGAHVTQVGNAQGGGNPQLGPGRVDLSNYSGGPTFDASPGGALLPQGGNRISNLALVQPNTSAVVSNPGGATGAMTVATGTMSMTARGGLQSAPQPQLNPAPERPQLAGAPELPKLPPSSQPSLPELRTSQHPDYQLSTYQQPSVRSGDPLAVRTNASSALDRPGPEFSAHGGDVDFGPRNNGGIDEIINQSSGRASQPEPQPQMQSQPEPEGRQFADPLTSEDFNVLPPKDSVLPELNLSREGGESLDFGPRGASSTNRVEPNRPNGSPSSESGRIFSVAARADNLHPAALLGLQQRARSMTPAEAADLVNGMPAERLANLPEEVRVVLEENVRSALPSSDPQIVSALDGLRRAREEAARGSTAAERLDASLTNKDRELIASETRNAVDNVIRNPVTDMVANEGAFYDTLREAKARGLEAGVMLADLNKFSTYNDLGGMELGDEAIALASRHLARTAERLKEIHPDFDFLPGRKAGDEMFMVAVPLNGTTVPDVVAKDMMRIYLEELQAYNMTSDVPIPTASAGVGVVRPGDYDNDFELSNILHKIDTGPVKLFNNDPIPGTTLQRNAAEMNGDPLLGPVYDQTDGQSMQGFRAMQGGLTGSYPTDRDEANVAQGDGPWARPQMIPGEGEKVNREDADPLNPAPLTTAGTRNSLNIGSGVADELDAARELGPFESNLRSLRADGIDILNQTVALPRLDSMLNAARRDGGELTLEGYEPRGLKELNDKAYILVEKTDDNGNTVIEKKAVGHHGGNIAIEYMVRANDQAMREVLGPDATAHVPTFRDRGKRFMNIIPSNVSPEQWARVQQRRDEIYSSMPAVMDIGDGKRYQIMMPDNSPSGGHAFSFSMGYAAVRLDAQQFPNETAGSFRDRLVAPVIRNPTDESKELSLLDIGKELADGRPSGELMRRLNSSGAVDQPGLEFFLSPSQQGTGPSRRQGF